MSASFLFNFIYSQWFVTMPKPQKDHTGETIIVTGSNIGLGLEAARHFTSLNAAKVIIAVRTISKGEEAAASIAASTGRKGVAEVWQLDLSNYQSIKDFTKRVQGLDRLDAIVENAAIATPNFRVAEGLEQTLTTNVTGTFLLALGVLPKLRESAAKTGKPGHLAIGEGENMLDALSDKGRAVMSDRYNVSKLLEVFFTRELAKRSPARNEKGAVIINFLNPGLCHSSLSREAPFMLEVMKFLLARSTEHGSRTLVNAVEQSEGSHGGYLSDCGVVK
ncbi:uncharacterized protein KY384_001753 [Bacidia gigantensis]|uniref:uncharacterized protein n=1 Tax=Bacidia gigantensis TaxID=2732470 RepID=UPI001D046C9E|nr:uncharacterized protein KY384_001753 [Bacidia gigantensis]KAG8532971.1 hypothetical protein KY384_001753 [Bacidia gigantensis]